MDLRSIVISTILQTSSLLVVLSVIIPLALILIIIYTWQYRKLARKFSKKNLNEAFRQKKLLEQLFDSLPDRVYFKDRESRFILANKFVSRIMGEEDPRQLFGKTDFDFYEPRFAQAYYDDEQKIMAEGRPMISKEEKGLDMDGNEIYVSTTKIPIFDDRNKVIGIIGLGRDITPQKKAERELKQKSENLRTINLLLEERQEEIEEMAEEINAQSEKLKKFNEELERLSLVASKTENTVIIMDGNANFEWANDAFEKKYKMNLDSFKEEHGSNLRENSSHPNISVILNQVYITRKPYTYNSKYIDKTGKELWNQTNIFPILDLEDEVTNLILIDSDITDLKVAEEQIKKQNEEIESQARELQKTNATKDRLFSIIAHDLKNPFHSILGFTEILKQQYDEITVEKQQEFLDMIHASTQSAYELLENLLDWARTQTRKVNMKPSRLQLSELVDEVISLQSLQASVKNIQLINEIDKGTEVYADKNLINTVIRNIVGNAIKYTREGGRVSLSATQKNTHVKIMITDTGIGMMESQRKALFELDRMNSSAGTSGETGTGLGLIVCHEFMKLNGGHISVDSDPGKGSTFTMTLPGKGTS
ncbi:MAG: PAS domain-containing protein [Bacteroidales bacterium]|nr:PAS domain-containing protein [Bacteroidales bacterium]MDT8430483.1 PAS domain-containing protein [Bacteroidales bacterium]